MDLILISSTKLKIMLTSSDMAAYSLTCDSIDYDNTETRRAFWDILDTAKHKTGFDAASDRVYIQVYPSKGGGCEMYVTKLAKSDNTKLYYKKSIAEKPQVNLEVTCHSQKQYDYDIYSFCEFHHMLDACRQLILSGYKGSSSIWAGEVIRRYYLAVEKTLEGQCSFLDEYGSKHVSRAAFTYVKEHCRCICENKAAEIMATLV